MRISLRRLSPFLFFTLLLLGMAVGCHRAPKVNEAEWADSVLTQSTAQIFTNPAAADSQLTWLQQGLTDSLVWYKVQVFRGTARHLMGDTLRSAAIYKQVEAWCKQNESERHNVEGVLCNHLGVNANLLGDAPQSFAYYERAFDLLNRPPKQKELLGTTINLADIYMQKGQMARSASLYQYALFLTDSLHDEQSRASILMGLGQVYMDLENFPKSHYFFNQAKKHLTKEPIQSQFFYHFSLGNCLYYEQRYGESYQQFERALQLGHSLNLPSLTVSCYANMGEVALMKNDLLRAEQNLRRCEELLQSGKATLDRSRRFYIQSLIYDLDIAKGNYQLVSHALRPEADSVLSGLPPRYLMLHYRRLQHYAMQSHQWHDALRLQTRADAFADSLKNLQAQNNVAEMELRYQRDTTLLQQRVKLAELSTQSMRQRSYIIMGVGALIVVALAATLAFMFYNHRTQRRFKLQLEQITQLRMDIVRNRVSPHYVFNVLNTVLPKLQQFPEMVKPIELLIDVLRGNLLASGHMAVPLCDELMLVRRFVTLHHYSKSQLPHVVWDVAPELLEADSSWQVPTMSIEIPVENALKHAFPNLTDDCTIHISAHVVDNALQIKVTDNGQGYNPGRIKRTKRDTGTGLRLITRTLQILNQYNRQTAEFTIQNAPSPQHGTYITLTIPQGYNLIPPVRGVIFESDN